ncbi:MAG: SDR family oxidoreductase [Roseitalea porphyridii]|jgi:NAD(P)-dependent dehydrogenase (short-subunit alcohol dehydrogenase family)
MALPAPHHGEEERMKDILKGRRAVITGGGRGIGRAIAARLGEHGATGHIFDLADVLDGATLPDGYSGQPVDIASEQEVRAAFEQVAADGAGLDIVVANAGIVPVWRHSDGLDLEEWDRVFAINVRGVAATLKHAVPLMKDKGGAIVVTASINSLKGAALQGAYTSSKHALLGLVRCAALELGAHDIRVNALAPGPVLSEAMRERLRYRAGKGGPSEAEAEVQLAAQAPLNRVATEDDVADGALFLASPLSNAVTGHILPIDGGFGIA